MDATVKTTKTLEDLGILTSSITNKLADPQWEAADRCYDWRNHIPIEIKEHWAELSTDAQQVAYVLATVEADKENWDD